MHTRSLLPHVILTVVLIGVSLIVQAGSNGRIEGTITDKATGNPVMGASVVVIGTSHAATTDQNGRYAISNVRPGACTVRISHLDYQTVEIGSAVVKPDQVSVISVAMEKKAIALDDKISMTVETDMIGKLQEHSVHIMAGAAAGIPAATIQSTRLAPPPQKRGCEYRYGFPPAHGGTAVVNGEPFDAMFFKNYGVNPFVDTEDDHLSTFAIDVDDASYVMTRSYLNRGSLPPDEAVRTEEFVNHFDYSYAAPGDKAFEVYLEGAPSRFGRNCRLLRIGIKGRQVRPENRKPANLVFVIDVSGSMAREDRLGLVKKGLRLLLDELREDDKVGIVTYGSRGRVVLEPTSIADRDRIVSAIESLYSGGSTFAEEGIRFGYQMAERNLETGKINRIILCSDGVANVGRTGADDILKEIERYADMGITLTSVGFGMGNFNDILLEKLGNKGNGHYAYVDNLSEARRIFVDNLTGILQVIARDVKIQVDFNPDAVRSYRLLGYENRDVDDNKFRDDKEDGGEVGSGHDVTALYEIKFEKNVSRSKVGTIYIRYKDPDSDEVTEVSKKITASIFNRSFDNSSIGFRLAAATAEFAEILRKSYWAKDSDLKDVLALVREVSNQTESADVIELLALVSKAQQYREQLAKN